MTSSNTKNFFATNLSQLQNFIKRDSTSYKDEVYLKVNFQLKLYSILKLLKKLTKKVLANLSKL